MWFDKMEDRQCSVFNLFRVLMVLSFVLTSSHGGHAKRLDGEKTPTFDCRKFVELPLGVPSKFQALSIFLDVEATKESCDIKSVVDRKNKYRYQFWIFYANLTALLNLQNLNAADILPALNLFKHKNYNCDEMNVYFKIFEQFILSNAIVFSDDYIETFVSISLVNRSSCPGNYERLMVTLAHLGDLSFGKQQPPKKIKSAYARHKNYIDRLLINGARSGDAQFQLYVARIHRNNYPTRKKLTAEMYYSAFVNGSVIAAFELFDFVLLNKLRLEEKKMVLIEKFILGLGLKNTTIRCEYLRRVKCKVTAKVTESTLLYKVCISGNNCDPSSLFAGLLEIRDW